MIYFDRRDIPLIHKIILIPVFLNIPMMFYLGIITLLEFKTMWNFIIIIFIFIIIITIHVLSYYQFKMKKRKDKYLSNKYLLVSEIIILMFALIVEIFNINKYFVDIIIISYIGFWFITGGIITFILIGIEFVGQIKKHFI